MVKNEEVHLVSYDPTWPTKFKEEKMLLEATIGSWIFQGLHHVGSTAIPGLSAKPIIDIMVGVKNLEEAKACISLLASIDYQYFPYKKDMMLWFLKPSPEKRTHHLYLIEPSHPEWKARLAFRDYLRSHSEIRVEYEALKTSLAEKFRYDREAYTLAKADFVKAIAAKALRAES